MARTGPVRTPNVSRAPARTLFPLRNEAHCSRVRLLSPPVAARSRMLLHVVFRGNTRSKTIKNGLRQNILTPTAILLLLPRFESSGAPRARRRHNDGSTYELSNCHRLGVQILPKRQIDAFGLEILPLTFMVDGVQHRSYLKGEKTDLRQFYTMMREGKVITTSLPNMQETETALRRVLDAGHDVLYLGFSSALSGTYESFTELLMKQLAGEYPDRTLCAVETLAASGGEGMLVYLACKKKEAGASLEEVADFVRETRDHLCHWFTSR